MGRWQRSQYHGKSREREKTPGVAEQNLIAPPLFPGHGTQDNTAVLSPCCSGHCLPGPSTPPSLSVATGSGEPATLFLAPGTSALFGRQNLRLSVLSNATLFCRREERGGLLGGDGGWVCSSPPLKRVQLCPSDLGLCWIMQGGKHRELCGDLKLECGVGSAAFTWEQPSLPLIEGCCVATSQIIHSLGRRNALGLGLWCSSLCLGIPVLHISALTRPLRPEVSRGPYSPPQPFIVVCSGCGWRPGLTLVVENHTHTNVHAHSCRLFKKEVVLGTATSISDRPHPARLVSPASPQTSQMLL